MLNEGEGDMGVHCTVETYHLKFFQKSLMINP